MSGSLLESFSEVNYVLKSLTIIQNFGEPSEPSSGDPCGAFWLPSGSATIPEQSAKVSQGGHYFGPIPPGGGLARYGLLVITNN